MTRWASGNNATEAAKQSIVLVILVSLDFASGTLYVHDGFGTLTFGGNDYLGLGKLGGIDQVSEDLENVSKTVQLTLSGVDPSLITTAMTENYQGRLVKIYAGLLDITTNVFIDTPESFWAGRMDFMTIDLSQGGATMRMNCEHRTYREPVIARYTDQDQQLAYPGDTFFNLLWQIPNAIAQWGSVTASYPANVPPTGIPGGRGGSGGGSGGGKGGGK